MGSVAMVIHRTGLEAGHLNPAHLPIIRSSIDGDGLRYDPRWAFGPAEAGTGV